MMHRKLTSNFVAVQLMDNANAMYMANADRNADIIINVTIAFTSHQRILRLQPVLYRAHQIPSSGYDKVDLKES